jgi:hypothetical protein
MYAGDIGKGRCNAVLLPERLDDLKDRLLSRRKGVWHTAIDTLTSVSVSSLHLEVSLPKSPPSCPFSLRLLEVARTICFAPDAETRVRMTAMVRHFGWPSVESICLWRMG